MCEPACIADCFFPFGAISIDYAVSFFGRGDWGTEADKPFAYMVTQSKLNWHHVIDRQMAVRKTVFSVFNAQSQLAAETRF